MKRSKYGVRIDAAGKEARTVDNIRFDSLREAKRYRELKLLSQAGKIKGFCWDKKFLKWHLDLMGVHIGTYTADFSYIDPERGAVYEDVKGHRTRDYVMKKRLMKALHGIDIQEV